MSITTRYHVFVYISEEAYDFAHSDPDREREFHRQLSLAAPDCEINHNGRVFISSYYSSMSLAQRCEAQLHKLSQVWTDLARNHKEEEA